jgi:hypothetical protein
VLCSLLFDCSRMEAIGTTFDTLLMIDCLQRGAPTEEEVKDWAWHSCVDNVDDKVLHVIGADNISFVFTLHVPGCAVQEQCGIQEGGQAQGHKYGSTVLLTAFNIVTTSVTHITVHNIATSVLSTLCNARMC